MYGEHISAVGVIGIEDFYLIEGSVNGNIFLNFMQRYLILPFDGDNPQISNSDRQGCNPSCGGCCGPVDSS